MTCLAATRVNRRAVRSGSWCPGGAMDGGISARATSATLPPDGPSRKKLPLVARAPWGIAGWTTTKRRGERRQEMENVSPSIENPSLGVGSSQVSGQNPVVVDTRPAVTGLLGRETRDIYVLGDPDLKVDGCELAVSCPTRQHPILPFFDLVRPDTPVLQFSRVITCILVPNFAEEGSIPGSHHHQAETSKSTG